MKPFIIGEPFGKHPTLVFSKDQLREINITPGKFVDELDSIIDDAYIIGYHTQDQYVHEAGEIQIKTLVCVDFEWFNPFNESDAEYILDQYKFIINEYYKKM